MKTTSDADKLNSEAGFQKVVHIDAVGSIIEELREKYGNGEVKGLIVTIVREDGTFELLWSNTMSYLERLGLTEAAKMAMLYNDLAKE
jgi:hypothetical protein